MHKLFLYPVPVKKDGRLKFAITHGTLHLPTSGKRLENESEVGKGTVSDENVYVEIPDLDEGTYLIEIFDNFEMFRWCRAM